MAFTGNFMCTSFKKELLEGGHNFLLSGGDTFKLALYDNNASFTAATTDYTVTNEVGDSGSYAAVAVSLLASTLPLLVRQRSRTLLT